VVAVLLALGIPSLLTACEPSEASKIGACEIAPGSDCAGNYMRGAHLEYSVLFDTNFDAADLSNVDLSWSGMANVSARGARLVGTKLVGAQLGYADFAGADLSNADLTGAVLTETNFAGANMSGTITTDALLCRTIMPDGTVANPDCVVPQTTP
jgi:uncharacterized protein YjbI with pentapeptide repeats